MTDVQEFCLRWNNHQSNLVTAFHNLRLDHDFLDVTLACDGRNLQAHKVVLSACSPFFRDVLKTTPCKHPVIILRDISYFDLAALVEFMYQGEVRIGHDFLPSFLRTAEVLKVKGLADDMSLRQKAISQQLAEGQHQLGQNGSKDIFGTAATTMTPASTQHISEITVMTEVKREDTNELPETSHAEYTESALTDSFEDDVVEDHVVQQPLLTLQSFARIQSALPPVVFNGIPGEVPLETMDNQDFSGIGLGTSRDPQSPHECPYCNRRICNLYALRRHIRDRHNTQNSVFPCDLCGRTYRTKNSLTTHRSVKHRPPPASSPTSLHMMRFQAKDDHIRMIYN